MHDPGQIDEVVRKAASSALKGVELSRVFTRPAIDSEGHEALQVTIVFGVGKGADVTGNAALDAIVRIKRDLSRFGEERFPIVEFATEDELVANGGP